MLDIKFITEHVDDVRRAIRTKLIACDLDRLLAVNQRRKELQTEFDRLRGESNDLGANLALYRNPKSKWYQEAVAKGMNEAQIKAEAEKTQSRLTEIKNRNKEIEAEQKGVDRKSTRLNSSH